MTEKGNIIIQYLFAYSVAVVCVSMGAFSSWPAPVMPKFRNNETELRVSDNEMSWIVSMSSPGFIAGSLVCRFLADSFGRRTTLLLSVMPFFIATLIVVFAMEAWMIYITRFIWGFGSGIIGALGGIYIAEIVDKEIRGSLTLVLRFTFNFGNLFVMCIGPFVSYKLLNFLLLSLPVASFLACWWIPESPYYCLKEGKVNEARKVLKRIRKYKDDRALEDDLMEMQADVKKEMRDASTAKELFTNKKYRKAVIICAVLKLSQIMTGQLVLQQYLGLIMSESGTMIDLSLIFITFGVFRFLAGVTSSVLVDKVGRRPLLIYSYFGTGLCLAIIGTYFFLLEFIKIDQQSLRPYSFIPFVAINISSVISTLGYYSMIILIPAEIFPVNVKAVAMTSICMFGGSLNFLEAKGYQVIKDVFGLTGVFCFVAISAFSGCVFSTFYVPETKGKSLKEIQVFLQGALYDTNDSVKDKDESRELLNLNGGVCK